MSVDPSKHQNLFSKVFTKRSQEDLNSLSHRFELLLRQTNDLGDRDAWIAFRKRQAGICCNGLIYILRNSGKTTWEYHNNKYTLDEFESFIVPQFNDFLDEKHWEIETLSDYIFDTVNAYELFDPKTYVQDLKKSQQRGKKFKGVVKIPFPMNFHLYECINNLYITSYFDQDDKERISQILRHLKEDFKILEDQVSICDIYSFHRVSFDIGDISEEEKLENLLLKELQKFKVPKETNSLEYVQNVLIKIITAYASNFLNLFETYHDEFDKLKIHFQIYSKSMRLLLSIQEPDEVTQDEIHMDAFKLILIESLRKHFSTFDSENMLELCKTVQNELDVQSRRIAPVFQPYYSGARKKLISTYLELLIDKVTEFATSRNDYQTTIILFSTLRDEIIKHQLKDLWKKIDYRGVLSGPLQKWINGFQNNFTDYIYESCKNDNWKTCKGERWISQSAMDVQMFLKNSTQNLNRIILPSGSEFLRGFAQCCAGSIQHYINQMSQELPLPSEVIQDFRRLESQKPLNKLAKKLIGDLSRKKNHKIDLYTTDKIWVRLQNILYLTGVLKSFFADVNRTFVDFQSNVPDLADINFDQIFKGTQMVSKSSIETICIYLAARMVFVDFDSKISKLYTPSVQYCTLRSVIDTQVVPMIKSVLENVQDDEISEFILFNLFKNMTLYVSLAIMDGSNVLMTPNDSKELLSDIYDLEDVFSEYIDSIKFQKFVLKCTNRIKSNFNEFKPLDIIHFVISQPSKVLVDGNGKDIQGWNSYPPNASNSVWNRQVIYKVLSHRNDSDAKKFITKHDYKYN